MAKRGPKAPHVAKHIDPNEVEKLAAMACTAEEIGAFFECSQDTIERNFADALKKGRAKGRMSMKRALFQKVQAGDLGAMVWWGKNFAGMSDKQQVEVHDQNASQQTLVITELGSKILGAIEKWNG